MELVICCSLFFIVTILGLALRETTKRISELEDEILKIKQVLKGYRKNETLW